MIERVLMKGYRGRVVKGLLSVVLALEFILMPMNSITAYADDAITVAEDSSSTYTPT